MLFCQLAVAQRSVAVRLIVTGLVEPKLTSGFRQGGERLRA